MIRDLTEKNYNKTYTVKRICIGCSTALVNYGNRGRAFLVHQNTKGYYICDGSQKRYFDTAMNKLLKIRRIVGVSEAVEKEIINMFE